MVRAPFLFPAGCKMGEENLVLHARSNRHRVDNFAGPLSIKTVGSGRVAWIVDGRELIVDAHSVLVLSAGERYSMNIDSERPVETCCSFFANGFVERLAADLTASPDHALSDEYSPALCAPYLTALHSDSTIRADLQALARRCESLLNPLGADEAFLSLGVALLKLYKSIREQIQRIPASRASTRDELYRRILIGRDYLHAHLRDPVSLASISKAACLSQFHFHRGFAQAIGVTPHSYLTQLRLARARGLLEGGCPVLQTCLDVGFSSPSAFSRLFKSHFGIAPSTVKRQFARSGKKSVPISITLGA